MQDSSPHLLSAFIEAKAKLAYLRKADEDYLTYRQTQESETKDKITEGHSTLMSLKPFQEEK